MHLVASVCPSVCPFVRLSVLSRLNHHYQCKVFVCVSVIRGRIRYTDNSADAVDRRFNYFMFMFLSRSGVYRKWDIFA